MCSPFKQAPDFVKEGAFQVVCVNQYYTVYIVKIVIKLSCASLSNINSIKLSIPEESLVCINDLTEYPKLIITYFLDLCINCSVAMYVLMHV